MPFPVLTRQELEAIIADRDGELEQTPYPLLLLAMAVHRKTAVLTLRRNQLRKEIVFEDGSPVDCSSNIVTETLGRFLVAARKLSEEDRHSSFSQSTARGVPLGEVLVERKLLTPSELYRMLQQNLGRKLLEPFSWKTGTYQISLDVPQVESPLRVKVPQLLVTGIMKVETQETADEAATLAEGKYLAFGNDPLFGPDDFRPSEDQKKVLDAAQKGKLFEKFRDASGIDPEDVNRILYALMLLGVVTTADWQVVTPAAAVSKPDRMPTAEVPFAAPSIAEGPTATSEKEQASAEEVIAAYLGHKRKDAFDLLGVSEDAGLLHVKEAFLEIADRFLPTKFDADAPDGIRDKAQDVILAAAKAYAELADDARREALTKHREKKREEAATPKQETKSKMIDPEELCRSGRDLAVSGKFREALSYFEMAAECDAQNGTYAAEAVWCRFKLGITPPSNADTMLRHALRRDPQSGVTHLYLGQVLAAQGKGVEAAAYLDRAGKLMPDDERPAKALKAVQ